MSLLTDEVRALEGRTKVYTAPEPFGAASGRYFGLAIGDANPLYSDPDYARAQGLAGVTAPLTLVCETNQYAGLPMDHEGYAGHTWDLDIPNSRQVRGGNSYTFHRRIRPEDVVTATWRITSVTEKVTGSGNAMLIIGSTATYTNQDDELLAENAETIIFVSLASSGAEKQA
jgi:N-terminal half of MaoC dehydratase